MAPTDLSATQPPTQTDPVATSVQRFTFALDDAKLQDQLQRMYRSLADPLDSALKFVNSAFAVSPPTKQQNVAPNPNAPVQSSIQSAVQTPQNLVTRGSLSVASGTKFLSHSFELDGIAANTNAAVPYGGGGTGRVVTIVMPWDVSLAGASLAINGAISAGTLTFTPVLEGTNADPLTITAGDGNTATRTYEQDKFKLPAGKRLWATVTTTASWAPTTTPINFCIWVYG